MISVGHAAPGQEILHCICKVKPWGASQGAAFPLVPAPAPAGVSALSSLSD